MIESKEGCEFLGNVMVLVVGRNAIRVQKGLLTAWIPRSQIHPDSSVFSGGERGELHVHSWFVNKIEWQS